MKIGISKLSFYVPEFYLDQIDLALAREIDPNKFTKGLLQNKIAVAPLYEDPISMALNASDKVLNDKLKEEIDLVIYATESGLDYSKAGATYLIDLLNINENAKAIEFKQACYSLTAGLYFAKAHIALNPLSKVLVVGSDIAKYGINTGGEPTQGAGAVAVIVEKDPKIMELNFYNSVFSGNIYDFWRPLNHEYALVDGHFSNEKYKEYFIKTSNDYFNKTNTSINDLKSIVFHTPYVKLGLRSLELISTNENHFNNYEQGTVYNKEVGNIYTGSLYLSLISLLENAALKENDKIGLYSYGSGVVAEFFEGIIMPNYQDHLLKDYHLDLIKSRTKLSVKEYEKIIKQNIIEDITFDLKKNQRFKLKEILNQQRHYIKI
ncbi:MAG: hydroxymethylglutaryl-CoA synthase [Acholeplasmataceae bacterium]